MTTFSFGPTITYVTDPSLSMTEQKRVLREVIHAAQGFMLRVGFRLPGATDDDLDRLLDWYWAEEATLSSISGLQGPLLHCRPNLADRYPDAAIWMPGRCLGSETDAWAYSVHTLQEAELAAKSRACEVIFGHVFETDSHPDEAGRGIAALQDARTGIAHVPAMTFTAIGGINEGSMYAMGAIEIMSVACIRAISTSRDIPETLSTMHQQWTRGFMDALEKGHKQ